ncbi:lipopolysaccharide biosynthesis protein [Micromonospora sp. CB01531]|uniref:lipopolysaccharide biosynthesis protein n=1 Tax=Micromonospora sp. CB01531 TaxID=1718947 RepID=UPI0011610DCA|nr:oligosaccharide flippase family protein [Micromonospora sp. CB01531]
MAQLLNLVAMMLVARLYPPSVFGRYATLAAVAALIGGVSALRLDVAATTAIAGDARVLLRTAMRLNAAAGAGASVAGILWCAVLGNLDRVRFLEMLALGALTATVGISGTLTYARVRDRKYGLVAWAKLLTAFAQGALQVGLGSVSRTPAMLLAATAVGYGAAVLLLRSKRSTADGVAGARDVLRRHRGFMVASAPASLINGLTMNLPLFFAGAFVGSAAAADLAVALRVGALPSALFGQALMPVLYGEIAHQLRHAPARARATYDRALLGLLLAGGVLLTGLSFAVYLAAPKVFGPQWSGASSMLALLTPFLISQFAVAPLSQTLSGVGRNRQQLMWDLARFSVTVAAFLPVLSGWLSWQEGIALFSIAMVVSYAAHVLLSRAALHPAPLPAAPVGTRTSAPNGRLPEPVS